VKNQKDRVCADDGNSHDAPVSRTPDATLAGVFTEKFARYADLITAYSVAQTLAFAYALLKGENATFDAVRQGWFTMIIAVAGSTWLYRYLRCCAAIRKSSSASTLDKRKCSSWQLAAPLPPGN
jgi:hypothetical protein